MDLLLSRADGGDCDVEDTSDLARLQAARLALVSFLYAATHLQAPSLILYARFHRHGKEAR